MLAQMVEVAVRNAQPIQNLRVSQLFRCAEGLKDDIIDVYKGGITQYD